MNKRYVLSVFRKAGFPLAHDCYCARYISSVVNIRYNYDFSEISVSLRGGCFKRFDSPAKAIKHIQRILSIQCVSENDLYLRRPVTRSFQLITGAA